VNISPAFTEALIAADTKNIKQHRRNCIFIYLLMLMIGYPVQPGCHDESAAQA
jgi:hypothetical protein